MNQQILDAIRSLSQWVELRDDWRERNWNSETDEPACGYGYWDETQATFNGEIAYAATLLLDALKENGIGGKA